MTFSRLARTASLAAGAVLLGTARRARARDSRAGASHPPEGRILFQDGLRLHLVERGRGPDLVLIHGASGSSRDFSHGLIDRLAADYRVLAFDRPGFGHSDPLPGGGSGLAEQAAWLAAASRTLGAEKPLVLGQSYGGAVAMAWALHHPAAAVIPVSAPLMPWDGRLDPWYRITARPAARRVLVPLASAWVPERYVERQIAAVFAPDPVPAGYLTHLGTDLTLRAGQLAINAGQINALLGQLQQLHRLWPGLDLPIELVHGDADAVVPADLHARALAPGLATARLTLLPGIGHMPHHAAPDHVVAAVHRAAERAGLR